MDNVTRLHPSPTMVTALLRTWYLEQAIDLEGRVAAITVGVTSDGSVITKSFGVQPTHLRAILDELGRLDGILRQHLKQPEGGSQIFEFKAKETNTQPT